MDKESINILVDSKSNFIQDTIKKTKIWQIGGQNIIALAIAIVIASYLSDIILYLLDDAILPVIYKLLDKLGNKEINIGSLKIDINKSVKYFLRFTILIILLMVLLVISRKLKLIN